jgi:hypothetical protein
MAERPPDKPVRAVDPLGLVALANVLRFHGNTECSCELKCVCDGKCSCELKCVCDQKDGTNILDLLSDPIFREVVKGLDINRMKTIEDFLGIVDEIRTKMNAAKLPPRSTGTSQP